MATDTDTTFLEMVNELLLRTNSSEVANVTDNKDHVKRAVKDLNRAQVTMARLDDWSILYRTNTFTATISDRSLDLTTDSATSEAARIDPSRELEWVYRTTPSRQTLRKLSSASWRGRTFTNVTGDPSGYRLGGLNATRNRVIELDPIPTSTNTIIIEHLQLPERMTANTDLPLMPAQGIIALALLARLDTKGDSFTRAERDLRLAIEPLQVLDRADPPHAMGTIRSDSAFLRALPGFDPESHLFLLDDL